MMESVVEERDAASASLSRSEAVFEQVRDWFRIWGLGAFGMSYTWPLVSMHTLEAKGLFSAGFVTVCLISRWYIHTYIHTHTHTHTQTHTHTHTHDQQMVYIYTHEAVASVFNHSTAQNLPQIHLMTVEYAKQEVMGLKAALEEAHGRHKETEEGALREKTHLQKALDEAQGQIEELRMKVESSAASTPANNAASGT